MKDEPKQDLHQIPLWTDNQTTGVEMADRRSRPRARGEQASGPVAAECLWDIKAVSLFLGVPVATIYQWRVKGEGPPASRMGKHLRFEPAAVRSWVTEQRNTA